MNKTRIPYEVLVAPREETIATYDRFVSRGVIPAVETDALNFQQVFQDLQGTSEPVSGWQHLARELRLVNLNCGDLPARGRTVASVRKDLLRVIEALTSSTVQMQTLMGNGQFLTAALNVRSQFDLHEDIEAVERVTSELSRIATELDDQRSPPTWRMSLTRRRRLKLATLLAPIFEYEFSQIARPVGGSSQPPNDEINDWTRFFQMAATVFWGERITPDRQAILWQASLPPARLSDFAGVVSDAKI